MSRAKGRFSPKTWLKLPPQSLPISTKLGVLGVPGISAYFGLLEICQPKFGETIVVSGAAGAVGSLVGQIWLVDELHFDGAFNYKVATDYPEQLKQLCPNGIDCYFDNVGGPISDAVMPLMNLFGRVAICGLIAEYGNDAPWLGPGPFGTILAKQLRVEGFVLTRFQNRWAEAIRQLIQWIDEGNLKYREEIVEGFTNMPRAFIGLLQGENTGKMLVKT
jgi:NADPH-dependent curcumin reductase CurA